MMGVEPISSGWKPEAQAVMPHLHLENITNLAPIADTFAFQTFLLAVDHVGMDGSVVLKKVQ
jgi:hypothetical protein